MKDDKLVRLIKNKPDEGLERAIDIYAPLVKTVVSGIIGYNNKNDIEECISDVFVQLWKSIDSYDVNKGMLKNYLISIARFVAINHCHRRLNKRELIPLEENEIDLSFDIDNNILSSINKSIIQETLDELEQPDKEIFIRRYFLYETVREIAQKLDVNEKLVENKLYRGKSRIRDALISKGINV